MVPRTIAASGKARLVEDLEPGGATLATSGCDGATIVMAGMRMRQGSRGSGRELLRGGAGDSGEDDLRRLRAGISSPEQGIDTRGASGLEHIVRLHIEKLPEGMYLATSDDVQGLIAQGRTIQETLEIARDVARKLIEARAGLGAVPLPPADETFDYPLVVAS